QSHHRHQRQGIADQARAHDLGFLPGQVVLGGVADEPPRVVHLVHDGVAGVDTGCAADTFDLQTVADVDARRANLYAHGAVDAIAQAHGLVVGVLLAWPAFLSATRVVGDDQGVLVEHHALEAGIGAHVDAHLLAQETDVAIGGEEAEADPDHRTSADLTGNQIRHQFADRCGVSYKGDAAGQGYAEPDAVLGELAEELVGAH